MSNDKSRLQGLHLPIKIKLDVPKKPKKGPKRNYKRGHCIICYKNTQIKCKQCKANLCIALIQTRS